MLTVNKYIYTLYSLSLFYDWFLFIYYYGFNDLSLEQKFSNCKLCGKSSRIVHEVENVTC